MIPGFPAARNARTAPRAHRNEPRRLTARTLSKSAADSSSESSGDLDAGVVDQDVQPPVLAEHPVEHLVHGLLVGNVCVDQDGLAACLGQFLHADLHPVLDRILGGDRALWLAHVVDGHAGALFAEADGDRLADAGTAPGDEGNLPVESFHDILPGWLAGAACSRARAVRKKAAAPAAVPICSIVRIAPKGAFQNA